MSDLSRFAQYNKLADHLIENVSKEELAECVGATCGGRRLYHSPQPVLRRPIWQNDLPMGANKSSV
jgi:hypothetical protein